jgi:hypothetical protein
MKNSLLKIFIRLSLSNKKVDKADSQFLDGGPPQKHINSLKQNLYSEQSDLLVLPSKYETEAAYM